MFAKQVLGVGVLLSVFIPGTALGADSKAEEKPQQPEFRTWTDITGKFKTEAAFLDLKDGNVRLKKKDGSVTTVALEKLSREDQEWLKERLPRAPEKRPGDQPPPKSVGLGNRGSLVGHTGGVGRVAFSPDGKTLASHAADGTIRFWDTVNLASRRRVEFSRKYCACIIFSPDGNLLAAASEKGPLAWDVATGNALTLTGKGGHVASVTFSADGKTIACGEADGRILFWDVTTRTQSRIFAAHNGGSVVALSFSPDGKRLASCAAKPRLDLGLAEDVEVKMWDVPTLKELNSFAKRYNRIIGATGAFSPDATRFLVPGSPLRFDLYDVATGERRRSFIQHGQFFPNTPAFSPDGKMFLQSGMAWLALVDVETGTLLAETTLKTTDSAHIRHVACSSDGKVVATAQGQNVELWDVILGSKGVGVR